VLAAVQAELLRLLLFDAPSNSSTSSNNKNNVATLQLSNYSMEDCLALAMARILTRAGVVRRDKDAENGNTTTTTTAQEGRFHVSIVLPDVPSGDYEELEWASLDPWPWGNATSSDAQEAVGVKCTAHVVTANHEAQLENEVFWYLKDLMHFFHMPGGVLLLVLSLVQTRGSNSLKEDMDDPNFSHLTSQFGHCSQELLNLLLTGTATSNVFDNTVNVDNSGLVCRGVSRRPAVGYLTQLESLRYCSVGSFYKTPTFPVWVLGSQNHFSVLFSSDPDAVRESESESVLERCRRAFRGVDNAQENGFIRASFLPAVLKSLEDDLPQLREANLPTLSATLEVDGAGIILWDDFWRITSRLLTGAQLESVLQHQLPTADGGSSVQAVTNETESLLDSASLVATSYETDGATMKTDEEMAKELAAQFESENGGMKDNPMHEVTKTDEQLARELQAQWDSEDNSKKMDAATTLSLFGENIQDHGAIVPFIHINKDQEQTPANTTTTSNIPQTTTDMDIVPQSQPDTTTSASTNTTTDSPAAAIPPNPTPAVAPSSHNIEFERFGDTFPLHHYNGLRGGILTSFKITKLSAEEAVGMSVALGNSTAGEAASTTNRNNGDLEDVVRTRWPSCVFDWGDSENGGGKMGDSLID